MLSYSVDCLVPDNSTVAEDKKQTKDWMGFLHSNRVKKILPIIKTSNTNAKKYFELLPLPTDQEALDKMDELING